MSHTGPTAHRFTREELYELVWSEPMAKLAGKLGVSDRGLAKACARGYIPVPPRGYWAKLQHGRRVIRPPLPSAKEGMPCLIAISPPLPVETPQALPTEILEQVAREQDPSRRVVVRKDLSKPHPIVQAWLDRRRLWHANPANAYGQIQPVPRLTLAERRRLRILSALLNALEKRGHQVGADSQDVRTIWVEIGQDRVEFTLAQRQRQVKVELSPGEKAESYNAMTGRQYRIEQHAINELVFKLRWPWWPDKKVHKEWREKPDRPLEEQLNDIVAGLIMAAAISREKRLERAEEERLHRERELERIRREKEERVEAQRVQGLMEDVRHWREVSAIRAYVGAVRDAFANGKLRVEATELQEWTSWALMQADRIDPLTNTSPWSEGT